MAATVSCKSCEHIRFDWSHFPFSIGSVYAWRCDRAKTKQETVLDPVNGRNIIEKPVRKLCVSARDAYGECGKDAVLWEPRRKKDFLIYLKRI